MERLTKMALSKRFQFLSLILLLSSTFTLSSCKKEEKAEHKVRFEVDANQNYDMWSFRYSLENDETGKTMYGIEAPQTWKEINFVGPAEFGWGFQNKDKSPINDTIFFKVYDNGNLVQNVSIYTEKSAEYGSFVIK